MFDEVGVKQSFENLSNSLGESNRAIVGEVTFLRNRLNKCMLPRQRISAGIKKEAKKTTVLQNDGAQEKTRESIEYWPSLIIKKLLYWDTSVSPPPPPLTGPLYYRDASILPIV